MNDIRKLQEIRSQGDKEQTLISTHFQVTQTRNES